MRWVHGRGWLQWRLYGLRLGRWYIGIAIERRTPTIVIGHGRLIGFE